MISSISELYLLGASAPAWQPKMFLDIAKCPLGTKIAVAEIRQLFSEHLGYISTLSSM